MFYRNGIALLMVIFATSQSLFGMHSVMRCDEQKRDDCSRFAMISVANHALDGEESDGGYKGDESDESDREHDEGIDAELSLLFDDCMLNSQGESGSEAESNVPTGRRNALHKQLERDIRHYNVRKKELPKSESHEQLLALLSRKNLSAENERKNMSDSDEEDDVVRLPEMGVAQLNFDQSRRDANKRRGTQRRSKQLLSDRERKHAWDKAVAEVAFSNTCDELGELALEEHGANERRTPESDGAASDDVSGQVRLQKRQCTQDVGIKRTLFGE